jgi:GDP-L-fucose synthase
MLSVSGRIAGCDVRAPEGIRETMSEVRKVVVTGPSGVIGTATVGLLREHGYDVVAATSSNVDLRDQAAVTEYFDHHSPDAVIHLAGRVHGLMGNVRAQGDMFHQNILINTHTIEAARRSGVRKFVAMGSVAMYPDGVPLPMRETDVWSGAPHASEAGYAHAKRAMLAQLESYHDQEGLDYAVAISTNLFGPDDRFDEVRGHVVPSLVSKFHRGVTEGVPVTVWGTGTATRDFLFSADAAAALEVMLRSGTGAYNLASGTPISIRDAVDVIAEVVDYRGEIDWDRSKPDGQPERAYDITKLAALGWSPQWSFRDAIADTYAWYARHHDSVRR